MLENYKKKQIEVLQVYEDHTEGSLKVGVDSYERIKTIILYSIILEMWG